MSVLVLGLGNSLRGDDGIGPRQVLEDWKQVVVVDAADVGQEPGQFVRFTPDQARLAQAADRFSLHHAGLSEALALASAVGRALPEIVIFGVQPAEVGWGEGLSPAVETALPALADAVLKEIAGICPKGEDYAQDPGD